MAPFSVAGSQGAVRAFDGGAALVRVSVVPAVLHSASITPPSTTVPLMLGRHREAPESGASPSRATEGPSMEQLLSVNQAAELLRTTVRFQGSRAPCS